MKNLRLMLETWRMSVAENVNSFITSLKSALAKNFNAEFLRYVALVLGMAIAISALVLSFMHSSRAGWWSVALIAVVLMGKRNYKDFWHAWAKFVIGAAYLCFLWYCIGAFIFTYFPPRISLDGYDAEYKILAGFLIFIFLFFIFGIFYHDYQDSLKKGSSGTEYMVRLFRNLIIFVLGVGTIYLLIHYLKPLIA